LDATSDPNGGANENESRITEMNILSTSEQAVIASHLSQHANSRLTKLAAWIDDRNIPFLVTSIGLIVMLLWAGAYKMTVPGADGIVPLVSNSPLTSWQFKLLGTYIGSDLIGLTEWTAALLLMAGYLKPKTGILARRLHRNPHVLYNQHHADNDSWHDSFGSWDLVHELFGPLPFQGCHILRGLSLPAQLFREKGNPGRAQRAVNAGRNPG
jgi:hypothetical protein